MKVETIVSAVAGVYQVTIYEIMRSRRRTEQIANARQMAMALSYEMTPLGSIQVGKAFNRDHGTVLHAVQAVKDRVLTDNNTAKWLAQVRAKLED